MAETKGLNPNFSLQELPEHQLQQSDYPIISVAAEKAHQELLKIGEEKGREEAIKDLGNQLDEAQKIAEELYTDPITKLPSNNALSRDLKRFKNQAILGNLSKVSFFIADVDYFKYVNDIYGHDFGDVMLNVYGQLINFSVDKQTTSIYRRTKGDEFVGLIPESKEEVVNEFLTNLNNNVDFFNKIESSSSISEEQMSDQQKEIYVFYQNLPKELKLIKRQGLLLPISISIGKSSCTFPDMQDISLINRENLIDNQIQLMFKDADDNLYTDKNKKDTRVKSFVLSVLEENLKLATNPDKQKSIQRCINNINQQ